MRITGQLTGYRTVKLADAEKTRQEMVDELTTALRKLGVWGSHINVETVLSTTDNITSVEVVVSAESNI